MLAVPPGFSLPSRASPSRLGKPSLRARIGGPPGRVYCAAKRQFGRRLGGDVRRDRAGACTILRSLELPDGPSTRPRLRLGAKV